MASQVGQFPQQLGRTPDHALALRIAAIERQLRAINSNDGIQAGGIGASYGSTVLATSALVAHWRLTDDSTTTAADAKGAWPGTYAGGYTQAQRGATADGSASVLLDGSTGRITTGLQFAAFAGLSMTFEGWAYRNSNGTIDTLVGGNLAATTNNMSLRCKAGSNDIEFFTNESAASVSWAGAAPGTGQWFHWALTYNDSTRVSELYINGVSKGTRTSPGSFANATQTLMIGAALYNSAVDGPWDGYLEDVAYFNRVLAANEIVAHYNSAWRQTATSQIGSGGIIGDNVLFNQITANHILVSQLSAIAADLGIINAGTITGGTIRTAASGARVELSGSSLKSYDSSNNVLFDLSGDHPAPTLVHSAGAALALTTGAQTWITSPSISVPNGKTFYFLGGGIVADTANLAQNTLSYYTGISGAVTPPSQSVTIIRNGSVPFITGRSRQNTSGSTVTMTGSLSLFANVNSQASAVSGSGWYLVMVF
jgi:hypothetical protein